MAFIPRPAATVEAPDLFFSLTVSQCYKKQDWFAIFSNAALLLSPPFFVARAATAAPNLWCDIRFRGSIIGEHSVHLAYTNMVNSHLNVDTRMLECALKSVPCVSARECVHG